MAIEIRNLSITSKVVQRQVASSGGDDAAADAADNGGRGTPPTDWRVECRRMILELLELQRER